MQQQQQHDLHRADAATPRDTPWRRLTDALTWGIAGYLALRGCRRLLMMALPTVAAGDDILATDINAHLSQTNANTSTLTSQGSTISSQGSTISSQGSTLSSQGSTLSSHTSTLATHTNDISTLKSQVSSLQAGSFSSINVSGAVNCGSVNCSGDVDAGSGHFKYNGTDLVDGSSGSTFLKSAGSKAFISVGGGTKMTVDSGGQIRCSGPDLIYSTSP